MRSIILILTALTISIVSCTSTSKIPSEVKSQEKYLFQELIDSELFLGMSMEELRIQRPKAEANSDGFNFREIYVDTAFSRRFNTAIYYIDRDYNKPVYEFILLVDNGLNANEIAIEKYGKPNHKNEWRFYAKDSDLPFDVAIWTFKNKVIIAGTLKDTEWEDGIE